MSTSKSLISSETTPLLLHPNRSHAVTATLHDKRRTLSYSISPSPVQHQSSLSSVGPLEISASTRRLIITGAWLGTFLASLNPALIPTMLSSISSEFEGSKQATWIGTSFFLATCAFTPLYGRLSDILGRRRTGQLALTLAALGAILSAMSGSMLMLIGARFISGVGSGGSLITTVIITSDMYILRHRSWVQGFTGVFFAAGQGIGGPLGGYISDQLGWRWAFVVQIPIYALSFFIFTYNLHYAMPGKSTSTKEILKKIDYGGTISLMLTIAFSLAFLNLRYGEQSSFTEPRVYITAAVSISMAVVFIVFELCVAPQPILAPSFLKQKVPVLAGLSNMLMAINDLASLYFFPIFFERVMLTSSSTAGTHIIPKSIAMTLGFVFGGAIITKSGSYKALGVVAASSSFIGTLCLANLSENSSTFMQWFSIVPIGLGNAVMLQTTVIALLAYVKPAQVATATGFSQLFMCVGQIAGVAVSSAVFQQLVGRELAARITGPEAEDIIASIEQSAKNIEKLPFGIQKHARDSYGIALSQVFWYLALSTFLGVLVQIAIPGRSLSECQQNQSTQKTVDSGLDSKERQLHRKASFNNYGRDLERQAEKSV